MRKLLVVRAPATVVMRGNLLAWHVSAMKRWRTVTFLTVSLRVFRNTWGPVGPEQVALVGPVFVFVLTLLLCVYLHGELIVMCMFLFSAHGGRRACTLTMLTLKPGLRVPRHIMVIGTLVLLVLVFLKYVKSILHLMLLPCVTNIENLFLGAVAGSTYILDEAPDVE